MNERGVALVTALLVVALASLAATALMSTASLAIHRTTALRDSEAAWWVARGVEPWVMGILKSDKNPGYDGFDEPWAQPVDALPIEQGYLRGHLVDLQGRFNLNNLLVPQTDPAYPRYQAHFQNLLRNLPGELQVPQGLIGAIRDWGDEDQNLTPPEGAEDGIYSSATPPYRTADRPFTVVSELRAVHGVTPEIYDALKDLVAALPLKPQAPNVAQPGASAATIGTTINVNTAPEAVLLALPGATPGPVESFVRSRAEKPAKSKGDVDPAFNDPRAPPVDVWSAWFQIQGEVFVGSSRVALYSLINRPTPTSAIVLAHSADAE